MNLVTYGIGGSASRLLLLGFGIGEYVPPPAPPPAAEASGGYWPDYGQPRRKRRVVSRETEVAESPAELETRMLRATEAIRTAKALRRAEARSREVTEQIKAIYAEQDRLEGRIVAMKGALQRQEDDELTMILSLAG
jgi:PAS domain-containing protein